MVPEPSVLVALVQLIDQLPLPPPTSRRGRPAVYSDRLFLKALVIMLVKHLPRVHTLLAVLDQALADTRPADPRDAPAARAAPRGGALPQSADLGAAPADDARAIASPDRVPGSL